MKEGEANATLLSLSLVKEESVSNNDLTIDAVCFMNAARILLSIVNTDATHSVSDDYIQVLTYHFEL